jgi:hypothetical protein
MDFYNVFVTIITLISNNIRKIDNNNNLKILLCQEFHSEINPNTEIVFIGTFFVCVRQPLQNTNVESVGRGRDREYRN